MYDTVKEDELQTALSKYLPLAGGTMNNGACIKFNTGYEAAGGGITTNDTIHMMWFPTSTSMVLGNSRATDISIRTNGASNLYHQVGIGTKYKIWDENNLPEKRIVKTSYPDKVLSNITSGNWYRICKIAGPYKAFLLSINHYTYSNFNPRSHLFSISIPHMPTTAPGIKMLSPNTNCFYDKIRLVYDNGYYIDIHASSSFKGNNIYASFIGDGVNDIEFILELSSEPSADANVYEFNISDIEVITNSQLLTESGKYLPLSGGTMTGSIKSTIGNILLNNNGEGLIYQESANKINYFGSALENTFLRGKGDIHLIKGSNQYKLWDSGNLPDPVKQSYSLRFDIMESYVAARFFNAAVGKKAADTYIEWWQSTNEGGGGWFNFAIGSLMANGNVSLINSGLLFKDNATVTTHSIRRNNGRLAIHGATSAEAGDLNVGSLLVSDSWSDASRVPANGIYSKGVTINDEHFIVGYTNNLTNGKWGYGFHYLDNANNAPYAGLGAQYSQGCIALYQKIRPKKGAEGWEWTGQNNLSSQNGIYLKLGFTKLLFGFAEKGDFACGETATVKEYGIWTEKELTKPKFAYGFEAIATGTSPIDLNTIFSETNGGYVYNYSGASKWVNAPSGMSYGGVYQLGYSGTLQSLYLQIAGDIVHATGNSKTGRLWYRMPGNGGLATAGWKRLLTEEDDLANILTKEKADTYYYPINGKGSLSFTTAGNPVINNNQGYAFKDASGNFVEAIWMSTANNLIIGKAANSAGILNNILIRGNLKTETGLNDYLYNYYDSPKFVRNLGLYASKTGVTGTWARTISIAEQPETTTRTSLGAYGGQGTVNYSYLGVFTGSEGYNKVNTLKVYTNNATFGNKSLAVWGAESNALTKQLYNRTLTINGTGWSVVGTASGNMSTIYAPTTVGTAGQILQSNGETPSWINQSDIIAGGLSNKITFADCVVSSYKDSDTSGVRIKMPFKATAGKMVTFSVRMYGGYAMRDLTFSCYLYNSNGGTLYSPRVVMSHGTSSINVKWGLDADKNVYICFNPGSYYGVMVYNVVGGYASGDWSTGWTITEGDASIITTVVVDKTVYPPQSSETDYLPLTGGTLTGTTILSGSYFVVDNSNSYEAFTRYTLNNVSKGAVGYHTSLGTFLYNYANKKYLFLDDTGNAKVGTISSSVNISLEGHTHTISQLSDLHSTWDAFMKAGLYTRTLGVNGDNWQFLSNINAATTSIYAPTAAGSSGQTLLSTGGVPGWGYPFILSGEYKGNGGVIAPSEIGSGKVYHRMMRGNPPTNTGTYCDWLLMDCYTGSDVPYVTGIGITKSTTPTAYIISAPKGNTNISSWVRKQLATTDLLTWDNIAEKPSTFKPTLSTEIDWNTIFTDSNWGFYAGSGNTPYSGGSVMGISIPLVSSANYGMQFAARNNRAFFRTKEAGTIGSWNEFYHTGHKPDWSEIANKPSTFTPASHTHSASDITSGTLALARIPTGTTSSTVALGNHTHSNYASSSHTHNRLTIEDNRDTTLLPNNMGSSSLRTFFNMQSNMPNTNWWAGIHVSGWTGGYASWELAGPSANATPAANALYFRTGVNTTWNAWKRVAFSDEIPTWSTLSGKPTSFSTSIANITDLNSTWDSILKASATSATFTPKAHNQASNTITAMTGYTKGSLTSAITTSDSLNTAIGKLELRIDGKLTTTSTSAGQATQVMVVTQLPTSPQANTLYLIVE